MNDKKVASSLPLFDKDKHWNFSDKPCEMCSCSEQVLYVLGKFKGESISCYRFLCCFCRKKLSYILG